MQIRCETSKALPLHPRWLPVRKQQQLKARVMASSISWLPAACPLPRAHASSAIFEDRILI